MDFFALEQKLITRLQAKVKFKNQPIDVYSVDEVKLDDKDEPQPLRVPCLLLSYDGYSTPDSRPTRVQIGQSWSVIVVMANVRGAGRAEARAESQDIVNQMLSALLGWQPTETDGRPFLPLKLVTPSIEPSYGARNSYFPFTFDTARVLQKTSVGDDA